MKILMKNYDDDTVTVTMTRLEAAALAAVYGEKTDSATIALVAEDYGEEVAQDLKKANEADPAAEFPSDTALYFMYELLDDIARGEE